MELFSKADLFESLITFIAIGSYVRVDLENLFAVVLGRTNAVDGVVPTCGGEAGTGPSGCIPFLGDEEGRLRWSKAEQRSACLQMLHPKQSQG